MVSKGGRLTLTASVSDGSMIIEVADTGCGIPEADQPKLFAKMFRADNARVIYTSGTGLGLYTVRAVLTMVGGEIWFASKEGEGSTFVAALPAEGMAERAGTHALEIAL